MIIGMEAFYNCSSLQNIILPPTVESIDMRAFMNCKSLKRLEFGTIYLNDENKTIVHLDNEHEKLKYIGYESFKNCSSLSSFRLPQLCDNIHRKAFMNCTSLTKFSGMIQRLEKIGSYAFFNCSSLNSFHISISNNEKEEGNDILSCLKIKENCFKNCTSLKEIVIKNESIKIDTMKQDKISQKSQILPNAFANCTSLTKAKFFIGNLSEIHQNAFLNCSSLKKIETNSPFYQSILNDDKMSFLGCQKGLTLELFNKNKKVNSFKIIVKKNKHSFRRLFKNHLSFLNKDFLSWPVKEEIEGKKMVKLHSTVINSFDGPRISMHLRCKTLPIPVTPGPPDYQKNWYHSYYYYYGHTAGFSSNRFPLSTNNVVTEYNYTIPTPRPPLNI